MLNKKLLILHLNEFDLKYLSKGANKYHCDNIKKLLRLKKLRQPPTIKYKIKILILGYNQ